MASAARRLAHNAPGELFVDDSCIDCDTCPWMAPETFVRREDQASVSAQPADDAALLRAQLALLSCPTGSIGDASKRDLAAARRALPAPIEGLADVLHCGYHHEASFGAASYLVRRDAGNVLVDSPRFTSALVERLEELGGVSLLFLTHRDDVADHARFAAHFGCERVLHRRDQRPETREVEAWIDGEDPVALADDLTAIPVPGHTEGSVCLAYRDEVLFTGDHLAWSEERGHPIAFRRACWFDWGEVVRSSERLFHHPFRWILPGHGRRAELPEGERDGLLAAALDWMREVA